MSMLIVHRMGDQITGSYNGKPFGVAYTEQKYAQMKDLEAKAAQAQSMDELKAILEDFESYTHEDYKELVEHAKGGQYLWVNPHTGKVYLAINGKTSSKALPQEFVDRIITSIEKNIDVQPLVKCWARFLRNVPGRPSYTDERARNFANYLNSTYTNAGYASELMEKHGLSYEVASDRATTNQVSITREGLLVCYKVSTEIRHRYELNEDEEVVEKSRYKKVVDPDTGLVTYEEPEYAEERLFEPVVMGQRGDEFWSGGKKGHHIRVGKAHWLESWDQVGYPGQKGLHVGGLRYIAGYQSEGTVTHNVFVDPMDIYGIAGLGYGSDGAMTVKRYFVYSSFAGVNKSIYHSSEYAKLTDKEFAELVAQAVEDTEAKKVELSEELDEQKNLQKL